MSKEQEKDPYKFLFTEYPDAVTPEIIGEMLNISTKTVYRLLSRKEIAAKKIGSRYIIAKIHVIDYLLK